MYADLVVLKDGNPIIVVEAKGRPIHGDFSTPVVRQLQELASAANAEWAILADPERVKVYRTRAFGRAAASFGIKELRPTRNSAAHEPTGEHTLLLAVERWLRDLPKDRNFIRAHPELKELAQGLVGADQYSFEYALG